MQVGGFSEIHYLLLCEVNRPFIPEIIILHKLQCPDDTTWSCIKRTSLLSLDFFGIISTLPRICFCCMAAPTELLGVTMTGCTYIWNWHFYQLVSFCGIIFEREFNTPVSIIKGLEEHFM